MIKANTIIKANKEVVWNLLENDLKCKFKIRDGKLLHSKMISNQANYLGKLIITEQEVTEYVELEKIVYVTFNDAQKVITTYGVQALDDTTTKVFYKMNVVGNVNPFRTLGFAISSLPILRSNKKKELKGYLYTIKQQLEQNII